MGGKHSYSYSPVVLLTALTTLFMGFWHFYPEYYDTSSIVEQEQEKAAAVMADNPWVGGIEVEKAPFDHEESSSLSSMTQLGKDALIAKLQAEANNTWKGQSPLTPDLMFTNNSYAYLWVNRPYEHTNNEEHEVVEKNCLPSICSKPKHLLPMESKWKYRLALASFPGSGNTWVRWLLQEGSRLLTSSVFCDSLLVHSGYPAECLREPFAFNRVIAVKTHYPAFKPSTFHRAGMPPPTAGLVILRAPLDAILSFFTLKTAHDMFGGDFHKKQIPLGMYKSKRFQDFVLLNAARYRKHAEKLNSRWPLGGEAKEIPMLLIYYEELVRFPKQTLTRIFHYIKYDLDMGNDRMPSIQDCVTCALQSFSGKEHRSHKSIFNPYTPELVQIICNETKLFWNTKLWGVCESGLLQSQRLNITFATNDAHSSLKSCL